MAAKVGAAPIDGAAAQRLDHEDRRQGLTHQGGRSGAPPEGEAAASHEPFFAGEPDQGVENQTKHDRVDVQLGDRERRRRDGAR